MTYVIIQSAYKTFDIWRLCGDCNYAHDKIASCTDDYEAANVMRALERSESRIDWKSLPPEEVE